MFQQALDKVSKQHLIRPSYGNFIGGKFVEPVEGRYFDNLSPVTGTNLSVLNCKGVAALLARKHAAAAGQDDRPATLFDHANLRGPGYFH
jgi:aldehyde dehydrogenase